MCVYCRGSVDEAHLVSITSLSLCHKSLVLTRLQIILSLLVVLLVLMLPVFSTALTPSIFFACKFCLLVCSLAVIFALVLYLPAFLFPCFSMCCVMFTAKTANLLPTPSTISPCFLSSKTFPIFYTCHSLSALGYNHCLLFFC